MKNGILSEETLSNESIENLMLISALAEPPYRNRALGELKKRRLVVCPDQFIDSFMTNLGIIC